MLVVNEENCIGCNLCSPHCPTGALKVWGRAILNVDDCTECLKCIEYCLRDALEVKE